MAKPFLKWAGGKSQLIPEITKRLPEYVYNKSPYQYIEPFSGSAAVAIHLLNSDYPPSKVVLNDINSDLVNLYQVIQSNPDELISHLEVIQSEYDKLENKEDKQPYYYQKRDYFNKRNGDAVYHAAIFIFLNKAGFNGLYRVNRKNEFNVPIGSYKKPNFVFEDNIRHVSKLLANTEVYNKNFDALLDLSSQNSLDMPTFFYFDPPYKPLNDSSSFTAYAKGSFNDDDQIKLKEYCDELDAQGHQWLLSNSDPTNTDTNNKFFDELYSEYTIERVQASRSINSKGSKRGKVNELLIRNY